MFFFSSFLFFFFSSLLPFGSRGRQGKTVDYRSSVDQVGGRWRGPVAAETMQARQGYAEFTTTKTG